MISNLQQSQDTYLLPEAELVLLVGADAHADRLAERSLCQAFTLAYELQSFRQGHDCTGLI
ncbi:hypothetical protein D3C80_2066440 [compost metagenome]